MPGHDDEYDEERILIPPLPPSFLKFCNLIDVMYNVEVGDFELIIFNKIKNLHTLCSLAHLLTLNIVTASKEFTFHIYLK